MNVDVELARQQLSQIHELVQALNLTLATEVVRVRVGTPLQPILDIAAPGTLVMLEPGTYPGPIVCKNPVVIRPSVDIPVGRRTPDWEPVILTSSGDTVRTQGRGITLAGLSVYSSNVDSQLVTIPDGAVTVTLDRMLLQGDPLKGQHRGVEANGQQMQILGSHINHCWHPSRDAQAVCGWNGTRDLIISDCYLAGGAETVMLGGADSIDSGHIPTNILVEKSELTKDPAWYGRGAVIKNCFELKSATNVILRDCDLSYAGAGGGQAGYLIVLTPRNQGGKAPWSTVAHVDIQRCLGHLCGGGINMMGSDSSNASGPLADVHISDTGISGIDPLSSVMFPGQYKGAGRGLLFQRAPDRITLERLALDGVNLQSGAYFIGPPPTTLVMAGVSCSKSKYGWKVDGGGQGLAAVRAWAPDATITDCLMPVG